MSTLEEWAEKFAPLSALENELLRALPEGRFASVERQPGQPGARVVRADFLRAFLLERETDIDPRGLRLKRALIEGQLDLSFAQLNRPLMFEQCVWWNVVNVRFACLPSLWLAQCRLRKGLLADGLRVGGSVFLNRARVWGEIRLLGVAISGNLECEGARFFNRGGTALNANNIKIAGSMFLRGAAIDGEINLLGAEIGASLECDEARLNNPTGVVLYLDRMKVAGDVFLRGNISIQGEVVLDGTSVDGLFDFRPEKESQIPELSLVGAKLNTWSYSPEGLNAVTQLRLDGWVYEKLLSSNNDDTHCDMRKRLPRDAFFKPQPYTQLAKALKADGHEDTARKVMIERQDALREVTPRWSLPWVWLSFQKMAAGYGYRPLFTLRWLLALWLLGATIFGVADYPSTRNTAFSERLMVPARLGTFRNGADAKPKDAVKVPSHYPRFEPLVYSLDALVPFLDLQQEEYWLPNADAGENRFSLPYLGSYTSGTLLRWYLWFHIAMGWLFGTMFVASVTGLIKKE